MYHGFYLKCKLTSEIRTASLQDLIQMYPLIRGSTILQGTVDLIPICPYSRVLCCNGNPLPSNGEGLWFFLLFCTHYNSITTALI